MLGNNIVTKQKITFSIFIGTLLFTHSSFAMDRNSYISLKNNPNKKEIIYAYVDGVGNAYLWSNSLLEKQKREPFFCLPRNLVLIPSDFINMLDADGLKGTSGSAPIEVQLLFSLANKFPCN